MANRSSPEAHSRLENQILSNRQIAQRARRARELLAQNVEPQANADRSRPEQISNSQVIATSRRQIVQRERRSPNEEMEQNLLHLAPAPASISQSTLKMNPSHEVVRAPRPTYLQLNFPIKSTLPRIPELKAKLARFGQLDVPAIRVYWKNYTCVVLYVYKEDAEDACMHCRSHDMFGGVNVSYRVTENGSGLAR